MVLASEPAARPDAPPRELRSQWGWFVALGVVMIVAGFIALVSLFLATVVAVTWVGVMMIVAGVLEIVHGIRMKRWSRFFLWIAIGALYILAGLFTFLNPLLASAVLTLMLGLFLIVAGAMRIFLAVQMRGGSSWGWVLASGIITVLLGAIIVFGWPVSSLYTLGIFLGVDLIAAGVSWVSAGLSFRSMPEEAARSA
jgi:uncharacterized membrane protein HdeD (DUF308 family)